MFRFRVVGLDEVYRDIFRLWEKILEDGFKPDLIVAILRGGYFPAKVLAELFGGLNLKTVEIKFYRNIDRKEKPKIVQPLYGYVKRKKVLLVDDVTDTGKTLTLAVKHLNQKGALKVKTATIHKKVWSKIKPDYYVYEVDWWVVYPWELIDFSITIGKKLKEEGETLKKASSLLLRKGLNLDKKPLKKFWRRLFLTP